MLSTAARGRSPVALELLMTREKLWCSQDHEQVGLPKMRQHLDEGSEHFPDNVLK